MLPHVRDIRRQGAAALDLCSVACGRLDAYYERGLAPWDLAAGGLVATEAGAVVTDLAGGPPRPDSVLAAAPGIADRPAGPPRRPDRRRTATGSPERAGVGTRDVIGSQRERHLNADRARHPSGP